MEKRKLIRNIIFMLILMCLGLWFALHKDFDKTIEALCTMHIGWGIVVVCMGFLYYGLSGLHIQLITKRYRSDYRLKEGIVCAYSCALFNGITPLGCGQVAQAYVLKKQGISTKDSLSILWMDFIVFQSVVLCYVLFLLICSLAYFYELHSHWFLFVLAGFAVNSFVIVLLWTMSHMPRLYARVSTLVISLGASLHIFKEPRKIKLAWESALSLFQEQIKAMGRDKRWIRKLIFIQLLRMTIYYMMPFFAVLSLGISMSLEQLLDVMAMAAFVHMLNALTPLPGDSGWSEGAFVMMFSTMFSWNTASAMMVIWRFASFHVILLAGMLLFLRFQQSNPLLRLCKEVQNPLACKKEEDYDSENLEEA